MRSFRQKVTTIRNGRVAFFTSTIHGPQRRTGRRLSRNFLAERGRDGWSLYHDRTGLLLIAPEGLTLVGCRALAERLEAACDWSKVQKATAAHGRIVSDITGCRLERIA